MSKMHYYSNKFSKSAS